jgi:hypothetical protein
VLRTSERARNIHTLVDIRDQKSNQMARVAAVNALEKLDNQSIAGGPAAQTPGVVIVIQGGQPQAALIRHDRSIDANPLIMHGAVHDGE